MADMVLTAGGIPAMGAAAIAKVRHLESMARRLPQVAIETRHVIHAGLYARTIVVPAGVMITGALIRIATLLIVEGDVIVYVDGVPVHVQGYAVLPASAGRKQAFVAQADTRLTMVFPTSAKTVEQAEREFTDEIYLLGSRHGAAANHVVITGE
jgi:hypothetical protein